VLLGLTGGYCAGKNAVADLLGVRGWTCVDVDRLGHEAVTRSRDAIVARFGGTVLASDGNVDRRALGAVVFSDPAALAAHEAIVHPVMFALLEERLEGLRSRGTETIVINAAILYRMPVAKRCDRIMEVRAALLLRLARARRRDGLGARRAFARIRSQGALWRARDEAGLRPLVLRNNGSEDCLAAVVGRLLDRDPVLRRSDAG
jgi:dephospho-CoA kinase